MEFAFIFLAVLVGILFIWVRSLGQSLDEAERRNSRQDELLQTLIRRVFELERQVFPPEAWTLPEPAPRVEQPAPEPADVPLTPELVKEPVFAAPSHAREDWETLIGGNLLNKLGVLILVVGIALFLGFSLTKLGPAGKVGIGFAVGLSMLLGGVRLEQSERYAVFSRGLTGGGWAAIYFTAYAMHGLAAARIVESPVAGTAILLLVSAGIIVHSLRYASETVTALAFIVGFVSLNLSPLTSFAVVATVILAVSAMAVAARLDWYRLAITGAVLTHFTFCARYELSIYGQPGLFNGMVTLWTYWATFEIFDLMDLRRRGLGRGMIRLFFWVNFSGFLISGIVHEEAMRAANWALFFAAASGVYLLDAWLRERITGTAPADGFFERLFAGGWEGAVAVSGGFCCAALTEQLTGVQLTLSLLVVGQAVVITGMRWKDPFLQTLGGIGLVLPFVRLIAADTATASDFYILGRKFEGWTPVALLMAGVFSANRFMMGRGLLYGLAASLLVAMVVEAELPDPWVAVAWGALAAGALYAGTRWGRIELRVQGYVLALAAFFAACADSIDAPETATRFATMILTAGLMYVSQFTLKPANTAEGYARAGLSIFGTTLLTALIIEEVQGRIMTVALGIEGILLIVFGFLARERVQRLSGLFLFLICIGKLFLYDLSELDTMSRILSFIVLGLMLLGASWIYTRFREQIRRLL